MLGRRAAKPVKIILADDSKDGLVDSAVDIENSDLSEYWNSSFDMRHIKLIEGEEPTYFLIKPLTRRQRDAADLMSGMKTLASWYIRCGLVKLYNYHIVNCDGTYTIAPHPVIKNHGEVGEIATEKWLDEVCFTDDVKKILHMAILNVSEAKAPLSVPSDLGSGGQE